MKYGLLVYKETENIGDDIQTYAAECFLPHVDYYVDRENLNTFRSDAGEQVAVIMNAWFLYHKYNWPPSPYIIPCFTAFHFTKMDFYLIGEDFFDPESIGYFQKFEPIGCRDHSTKVLLEKFGIQAYISGCVTLTIEKKKGIEKSNTICLVDVDAEIHNRIEYRKPQADIVLITHNIAKQEKFDWAARRQRVESLLETYQSAKLVITTRLHCALPCLALGTPVLLIYEDEEYFRDRMDFYLPMINHCTKEKFLNEEVVDLNNPPDNSGAYLSLRHNIAAYLKQFIADTQNRDSYFQIAKDHWYLQLKRQSELLQKQLPKLQKQQDMLWELGKQKEWQKQEIDWHKKNADSIVEWYENRETWYKKKTQENQDYFAKREEWYENRETWYKKKTQEDQDYFAKREEWYKNLIEQYEAQIEIKEKEIKEAENMLSQCQTEIQELKNECERMKSSYTWKLGSVILWMPRKIREVLCFAIHHG